MIEIALHVALMCGLLLWMRGYTALEPLRGFISRVRRSELEGMPPELVPTLDKAQRAGIASDAAVQDFASWLQKTLVVFEQNNRFFIVCWMRFLVIGMVALTGRVVLNSSALSEDFIWVCLGELMLAGAFMWMVTHLRSSSVWDKTISLEVLRWFHDRLLPENSPSESVRSYMNRSRYLGIDTRADLWYWSQETARNLWQKDPDRQAKALEWLPFGELLIGALYVCLILAIPTVHIL